MPVVSEPERSLERRIPQVAHYRATDESAAPFFFFFSPNYRSEKTTYFDCFKWGEEKNASRLLCAEVLNTHTVPHTSHTREGGS